jgi:hypothetical protein
MTKITIPAKQSNSGSIYDIASQHNDIIVDFKKKLYNYALLMPSYFNCMPEMCTSETDAIKTYKLLKSRGYEYITILGRDGTYYDLYNACGNNFSDAELRAV